MDAGNVAEKFAQFGEQWRPKVIAGLNGHEVKLVKVQGIFPWHLHEREDEMFFVWRGRFRVEFRDHVVELEPAAISSSRAASSIAPLPMKKPRC
jgi:mannose-6-phosphate isomerase-like protein (cupin superfamily)